MSLKWFTIFNLLLVASAHIPRFQQIYQFPNGTWIDNSAARPNGGLLVSLLTNGSVYHVDPFNPISAKLIYQFSNASGALGLVEYEEDVYAAISGNFSFSQGATIPGTYSIWSIDMHHSPRTEPKGFVKKLLDVPAAGFLNSLMVLNQQDQILLASDSSRGVVWSIDLKKKSYSVALNDTTMAPNAAGHLGVNGLHLRNGYLYYTNSDQELFARIKIQPNGSAAGKPEILVANQSVADFTLDEKGDAWIAQRQPNKLMHVTGIPSNIKAITVPGSENNPILPGPVSAEFGRTKFDSDVLYLTTTGGYLNPIPGYPRVGGAVVAYSTKP